MAKKTKHEDINTLLKELKRKNKEIAKWKEAIDRYIEDVAIEYDLLFDEDDKYAE